MGFNQTPRLNISLEAPSSKLASEVAEALAPVFAEESEALYGTAEVARAEIVRRYATASHVAVTRADDHIVGACCLEDTSTMDHWSSQGFRPGFEVAGLGVATSARGLGVATRLVNCLVDHVGFTPPILACTWAGAPSTAIFSSWTHLQAVPLQNSLLNVWWHPKSGEPFNYPRSIS